MNNNMGCIDTIMAYPSLVPENTMNNNMGCIDTIPIITNIRTNADEQ